MNTPDRDYLAEALAIADGTSIMCAQRAHILAVMEAFSGLHDVAIVTERQFRAARSQAWALEAEKTQ